MPSTHEPASVSKHPQSSEVIPSTVRKADAILEEMRLDLITGILAPGERVKIHELTDRYNVSQTTVREVLPKLAAEGFLVEMAQKGYHVLPISLEDFAELTQVRLDLELPALHQSVTHGGVEWEVGVLRAQHLMRVYVREEAQSDKAENTRGWIPVHRDYHASLIAGSPSMRRRQFCRSLFDQSARYFWLAAKSLASSKANLESHAELTDSVLSGNADNATEMLRIHIERVHDDIVEYSAQNGSILYKEQPEK